ncbi:MAG TPA: hypothetical protein VLV15_08965 [Dongiaceae bacterium]|nr:hypothetical protein [Dongiaceae bacterium]
MNAQLLVTHARLAAPFVKARLETRTLWKKLVAVIAPMPALVPVHVPVPGAGTARIVVAAAMLWSAAVMTNPADAQNYRPVRPTTWDWNVDGSLVDVSVVVDGSTAPLYSRPGVWDRHYFQAFKGRNYSLVVRNNSGRRVGVLLAVDGLNVVNGQRTQLSNREPMYVLGPYEVATIRGWRTSLDDVRRFVFVDEQKSYANRTDQANGDMGWIRVLAFNEQQPLAWDWRRTVAPRDEAREPEAQNEQDTRKDARPAPEASKQDARAQLGAPQTESNPGTGWGEQRRDPVTRTEFVAERSAKDQIILRYEYASGLAALGIVPRVDRTLQRESGQLGFAQPPRW